MRNAEARMAVAGRNEARSDDVETLWRLHASLPLEAYFQAVEDFIDQARRRIAAVADPAERSRLNEYYRGVIETAVNLACGIES